MTSYHKRLWRISELRGWLLIMFCKREFCTSEANPIPIRDVKAKRGQKGFGKWACRLLSVLYRGKCLPDMELRQGYYYNPLKKGACAFVWRCERYLELLQNTFTYLCPKVFRYFLDCLKEGKHLSVALDRNLFGATDLPVGCWVSLRFGGDYMLINIALCHDIT